MNNRIVGDTGKIIPQRQGKLKIVFYRLVKNWKIWVPFLSPFSVLALWLSWNANDISKKNREDFRAVEKLNLSPEILLSAYFNQSEKFTPHIAVRNIGPVKAVQSTIKFLELRYSPVHKKIKLAITRDEVRIPDLAPREYYNFKIPEQQNYNYFRKLSEVTKQPIEHFVIEVLISYRRESDLKLFSFKTFYFFDEEGNILSEKYIAAREKYQEVLESLYNTEIDKNLIETMNTMTADILHPVYEK